MSVHRHMDAGHNYDDLCIYELFNTSGHGLPHCLVQESENSVEDTMNTEKHQYTLCQSKVKRIRKTINHHTLLHYYNGFITTQ